MYIIEVFDQYFLKDDGEYVIQTYSPIVATSFKTKKEAKDYVANNTEWKKYAKIVKRTQKMVDEFNVWLVTMQRGKIKKIDRTGKHDFDPSKHGRDEVFKFWLDDQHLPDMSQQSYETWPELSDYFKNLYSIHRGDDNQFHIECWFRKGDDYHQFEKEMVYLFDQVNEDELTISVSDMFDSVTFTINRPLTDIKMSGRNISNQTYRTLKECFDFMVKERYYE